MFKYDGLLKWHIVRYSRVHSPHLVQVSRLAMAPKTKPDSDAPKSDAPKRPASAYFVFMAEKRAENPDEKMGTKVHMAS